MARDSLVTFVINDSPTSHGHWRTRICPPHYIIGNWSSFRRMVTTIPIAIGNSLSQEDQFLWFLVIAVLNWHYRGSSRSCYCSLGITQTIKKAQEDLLCVRGHHSPPPITPATSDSPRYIPPHKRPQSDLQVRPTCPTYVSDLRVQPTCPTYVSGLRG